MKKIIVKKLNDNPEYLIYLATEDGVKIKAEMVSSEEQKIEVINKYLGECDDFTLETENKESAERVVTQQHPLILVFYIDRETMQNGPLISSFANAVNDEIAAREANAMAFFLPTDGTERIECLNPVMVSEPNMTKINSMVNEIAKKFDVGQVTLDDTEGWDDQAHGPDIE